MTYQEMVSILRSYRIKKLEIEMYYNRMYGVKAITYSNEEKGTPIVDGLPINTYLDKIEKINKDLVEIELLVNQLEEGSMEYNTIFNKFINGMILEDVAEKYGYSLRQIQRYYRSGIIKLIDIKMSYNVTNK